MNAYGDSSNALDVFSRSFATQLLSKEVAPMKKRKLSKMTVVRVDTQAWGKDAPSSSMPN